MASDADLLAEQMLWAARTPAGRDQGFNTANGDVFRWRWLRSGSRRGSTWSGWVTTPSRTAMPVIP